jgi:hypothetical protein
MRFFRSTSSLAPLPALMGILLCNLLPPLRAVQAPSNLRVSITTPAENRMGVMTHFAQGWTPDWVSSVKDAGIPQVRDEVYWAQLEQVKGVFQFPAAFDAYMTALNQNGISPLLLLDYENPFYDGGQTPYTQAGFDAYARYAVGVLNHYGSQVKAVEIWNEYNGDFCHGPATADRSGTYVQMLRTAYAAIKAARADVTVVGGATAGVPLPYWEKIMAAGGLDSMDALSIHPYRIGSPPEGMETDITDLQKLVLKYNHGATKPIWVTEIGWPIKASQAAGDLAIDEPTQAKFLVRAYALLYSADVQRVYWYLLHDYQDFVMGLVRDDAGRTHRPSFVALATMIQQLKGAHFIQREQTLGDLYSMLYQRENGGELRIVWSLTPRHLVLTGATGEVTMAGQASTPGTGFDLDDSPVYIAGPLRGLPDPPVQGALLADSREDFGAGAINGWSYGTFSEGKTVFTPLPTYSLTDAQAQWTGADPSISITSVSQYPSVRDGLPVTAVRRWTSTYEGKIRVTGYFSCGTTGDGVGATFSINGTPQFHSLLNTANGVVHYFDLVETVHVGSTVDFAVDPGPGINTDSDTTSTIFTIRVEP